MKIKKVEILPIKPSNGLIGFAHIFLEEGLYLGSIGIFTKKEGYGYRLTYPTRKVNEKNITIFHPITWKCSKDFEEAIFNEAEKVFK